MMGWKRWRRPLWLSFPAGATPCAYIQLCSPFPVFPLVWCSIASTRGVKIPESSRNDPLQLARRIVKINHDDFQFFHNDHGFSENCQRTVPTFYKSSRPCHSLPCTPLFPYTFRTPHSIFCFNAELFFLNFAYNTTAAHFSPVGMIRYWPHIALVEGVGSFIGSISFDDGKSAE